MSIFNILILMVIIHCVGVSVGGVSVFNIYIILITTMFTSLLVNGVIISLMLTMFLKPLLY